MTSTDAAVFMSGNSQAIRLPKSFRINSARVSLERRDGAIIVREIPQTMQAFLDTLPVIADAPLSHEDGPEESIKPW